MAAPPSLTLADWLETETATGLRHEFIDGELYAMAGGTPQHARIGGALFAGLFSRLRGTPCEAFNSDTAVRVSAISYVYPDATVACHPEFGTAPDRSLMNPTVVCEVLSPTTEARDRGRKFQLYRDVPSMREVLFISSDRKLVEAYRLNDAGHWELRQYDEQNPNIEFASLNLVMDLESSTNAWSSSPCHRSSRRPRSRRTSGG